MSLTLTRATLCIYHLPCFHFSTLQLPGLYPVSTSDSRVPVSHFRHTEIRDWCSCWRIFQLIIWPSDTVYPELPRAFVNNPSFLFSLFLILTSLYLFTVGVEVIFAPDHTKWHTHTTLGMTPLNEGSAHRRKLYLTKQALIRDRHPILQWDSNSKSQLASCRKLS